MARKDIRTPVFVSATTCTHIFCALVLLIMVMTGAKEYALWGQVTRLWNGQVNPIESVLGLDPHGLRYILVYPIFWISTWTNIEYDTLFSFFVIGIFYRTCRNVDKTISIIPASTNHNRIGVSVLLTAMFLVLFILMNGRITFAFWGYSILILSLLRLYYQSDTSAKNGALILLGLTLCGVSSGTLTSSSVSFVLVTGAVLFSSNIIRTLQFRSLFAAILVGFFILTVANYIVVGFEKNLAYFGGGLTGLLGTLDHGFGIFFRHALIAINPVIVIGLLSVGGLLGWLILSKARHPMLFYIAFGAIACGAFGFSTLSISVIPLSVLLGSIMRRVKLFNTTSHGEIGHHAFLQHKSIIDY